MAINPPHGSRFGDGSNHAPGSGPYRGTQDRCAALQGVVVIDLASYAAGPHAARYLADFGADVIKVERPSGDPMRRIGWRAPDGDSYFWKVVGRNKRCVALDLKTNDGIRRFRQLVDRADILVENLRPGGLERLGIGPDRLLEQRPNLVMLRVSGYGQSGPYANLPGFATAAEGVGGYAGISGEAGGRPLLPPLPIADETAGLAGAFAAMVALRHAEHTGEGQVVDVNLADVMVQLLGPLVSVCAHEGVLQQRMGSSLPYTAPRGTYPCQEGKWLALSASSDGVASRLLELLGLGQDSRFASGPDRLANAEELDRIISDWTLARKQVDALKQLREADVVAAPVYTVAEILHDPHFRARSTVTTVGDTVMQGLIAALSRTPGHLRFAGRRLAADQQLLNRYEEDRP